MIDVAAPKLGIVSDSPLQRHRLQSTLSGNGVELVVSCSPEQFFDQRPERVDETECWVIALEDDGIDITDIMLCLDERGVPFLLGLELAPDKHDIAYISWQRRLLTKLKLQIASISAVEGASSIARIVAQFDDASGNLAVKKTGMRRERSPAKDVWVLAASLGGPAAVKDFLDELPADLDYGFLYAQHVDAHFSKVLTDVLGRHANIDLYPMVDGEPIMAGEVQVVPVDQQTEFNDRGCQVKAQEWSGPYGPSIDQLLANLYAYYGNRCNVIVFSGMGNDGALTIPQMHEGGCRVWTQSPESCASSSMPQAVLDLGCSDLCETPPNLAKALIDVAKNEGRFLKDRAGG